MRLQNVCPASVLGAQPCGPMDQQMQRGIGRALLDLNEETQPVSSGLEVHRVVRLKQRSRPRFRTGPAVSPIPDAYVAIVARRSMHPVLLRCCSNGATFAERI